MVLLCSYYVVLESFCAVTRMFWEVTREMQLLGCSGKFLGSCYAVTRVF